MSSTTLRKLEIDSSSGVCDFELEIEEFLKEHVLLSHKGGCPVRTEKRYAGKI
jgi:hypothetical protein